MYGHQGDAGKLASSRSYRGRKEADLQMRVDAAAADPQHAALLTWELAA